MDLSSLQVASPLSAAAWMALAGVPASIILLYFLKLRRRPVEVSSTLLWRKTLEDLQVNSLFQKLRRNLLLLLQLLMVALLMLALLGLTTSGTRSEGRRLILVLDHSASMTATDVAGEPILGSKPTRLDEAKRQALRVVREKSANDLVMVIAFANRAQVVSSYTADEYELVKRIEALEPTQATTSLRDALEVAAGLANPSKLIEPQEGEVATEVVPPEMFIFTDGGFPDVEDFSLGNLRPRVVLIGPKPSPTAPFEGGSASTSPGVVAQPSDNVGLIALQTRRNEERPDEYQVFGTIRNHRDTETRVMATLYAILPDDGTPVIEDAMEVVLGPRSDASVLFDRRAPEKGALLEVRLDVEDAFALDNRGFAVVSPPRKCRVLVATKGNRLLLQALQTEASQLLVETQVVTPDQLEQEATRNALRAGQYDLAIFDNCAPAEPPECNTLYFGAMPPGEPFAKARTVANPILLDWDSTHPLLQYVRDLRIIAVLEALVLDELPPAARSLIESDKGTLAFVTPRSGYLDAVVGFAISKEDRPGNTDWTLKIGFPLFLFNAVQTLGNADQALQGRLIQPGDTVTLLADALAESIQVTDPAGTVTTLKRNSQGTFLFEGAQRLGLYKATWENGSSHFAVNLFSPRESDLSTRGVPPEGTDQEFADEFKIKVGASRLESAESIVAAQRLWWKPFALAALGILIVEWYIYNRKVYV